MIKKISKLFLLFVALFTGVTAINAESAPSSLTISNYTIGSEPVIFPNASLNSSVNFHVKKTSDGTYVYCVHYAKKPPISSITYTKSSKITDTGINYILAYGRNAETDEDFFKYQTALWIYLVETGQMEGTHNDINRFIKTIASSNDSVSKEIRSIVEQAKSGDTYYAELPTVTLKDSNVTFTLENGYYVSSKIEVTTNTGKYDAELTSAPSGSEIDKHSDYFTIKVPASKVTKTTSIAYKVTNTKSVYTSYYYTPSNSSYQKMAYTDKTRHYGTDEGKATLTIEEKEPVITKIIKVDADTGAALKGATLQLTNSNGKIVATWTTDGNAKEFTDLASGTYTLTEVSAPDGYEKSNEKVVFKIDASGNLTDANGKSIDKVTFTNKKVEEPEEPQQPTGVTISKQDITNKKELPGATLVIKDYDGNIIKEFVSGTEPTYFELEPGIYTLTEIVAPEGYILSTETITFTVEDGKITDTVVMYNTPEGKEVVVENTASFKTITSTVIGLIVSVLGVSLVFKKNKNLV